jgi:hypothetical protein
MLNGAIEDMSPLIVVGDRDRPIVRLRKWLVIGDELFWKRRGRGTYRQLSNSLVDALGGRTISSV